MSVAQADFLYLNVRCYHRLGKDYSLSHLWLLQKNSLQFWNLLPSSLASNWRCLACATFRVLRRYSVHTTCLVLDYAWFSECSLQEVALVICWHRLGSNFFSPVRVENFQPPESEKRSAATTALTEIFFFCWKFGAKLEMDRITSQVWNFCLWFCEKLMSKTRRLASLTFCKPQSCRLGVNINCYPRHF